MVDPSLFDTEYELQLTPAELEKFRRPLGYRGRPGQRGEWGGNQILAAELQDRLHENRLSVMGQELDKVFCYAWGYGRGTWQDAYFKPLVSAGLRAGWTPPTDGDGTLRTALEAFHAGME